MRRIIYNAPFSVYLFLLNLPHEIGDDVRLELP
jgi:hypothetical protein